MFDHRDLPLLAVFAQACRDGSLTRAARSLGLSKSVVSAQIKALETTLGGRLLERTTRSLAPTQVGLDVLVVAERVVAAADEVRAVVEAQRQAPTGTLRVATTHDLGTRFVAPAVAQLCVTYPELRAEILLDDAVVDPIAHHLDAMVRLTVPADSSLVARRLADDTEIVLAGPGLAEEWQRAWQPKDLVGAPWVAHASFTTFKRHRFRKADGTEQEAVLPPPRAVANTTSGLLALIGGGAGLGILPSHTVREELAAGRIVRLVPDWGQRTLGVYLLSTSDLRATRWT